MPWYNDLRPFNRVFFRENKFFELPSVINGNLGGVLEIFRMLYREEDYKYYKEEMKAHKDDPGTLTSEDKYRKYFRDYWRKNQLSDHKPIWIEINIDSSDQFLKTKEEELEKLIQ